MLSSHSALPLSRTLSTTMAETAQLPYTIVDAFTTDVFRGNPAAVLVLERELPDATMQLIAREFNLSDTAFIARTADPSVFGMRWFTPGQEVTLCGHATLASVHVLNLPRVTFKTRFAGDITATKAPDGTVELEFPAGVSQRIETEGLEAKVANALRTACALPATPKINYVGTPPDPAFKGYLLVHIDDDIELESLKVDTGFLVSTSQSPCSPARYEHCARRQSFRICSRSSPTRRPLTSKRTVSTSSAACSQRRPACRRTLSADPRIASSRRTGRRSSASRARLPRSRSARARATSTWSGRVRSIPCRSEARL